jgi:hypothetical protein
MDPLKRKISNVPKSSNTPNGSKKPDKKKPLNDPPKLVFRLRRKANSEPFDILEIDEATLPINKKIFPNTLRELNNQLTKLAIDENKQVPGQISLVPETNKVENTNTEAVENKPEQPRFILKLADINKILHSSNTGSEEKTQEYRSSILKEHRKDFRESALNAKRDLSSKNNKNVVQTSENDKKITDLNQKTEQNTIVLVDIKSDFQEEDIIYCNNKPMQIEKNALDKNSKHRLDENDNAEYIEDYYYLEMASSDNYRLEKVRGKLYINASVHEYLAPYFYPDGDLLTDIRDNQQDICHQVDSDLEDRNNPDNYDSNAEYNSNNSYPDEPDYGDYNEQDDDDDEYGNEGDGDDDDKKYLTKNYFEDDFKKQIKQKIYSVSQKTDEINNHSDDDDDSF